MLTFSNNNNTENYTDIHRLKLGDTYERYLTRIGIYTIRELFNRTPEEIGRIRGVGRVAQEAIMKALDEWEKASSFDYSETPYHTKISSRAKSLIQELPPTKENQYEESIQELLLHHTTKYHLELQNIQTINDLLRYKEDELIHLIGLTHEEIQDIIRSVKDFRQGIRQHKRLGTLYPFDTAYHYEQEISSLLLSDFTENALKTANILTLGDLSQYTQNDLLAIDGIGQVRVDEITSRYKNSNHGTVYVNPEALYLPQSLDDAANRFHFNERTEKGLSRIPGYSNGEMTVRDLLSINIRTFPNIRYFGKESIMRVINTLSEWLNTHNIDPEPFILLKAYTTPTNITQELYRLPFGETALKTLHNWNSDPDVKISSLLTTNVSVFLDDLSIAPSIVGQIVRTVYKWMSEQQIINAGYELFKDDYRHQGVMQYFKHNKVRILDKNTDVMRKPMVKQTEEATPQGLLTKTVLTVRYNNSKYQITHGDELVSGYPTSFKLVTKI